MDPVDDAVAEPVPSVPARPGTARLWGAAVLAAVLVVLTVVLLTSLHGRSGTRVLGQNPAGAVAPDFTLPSLTGTRAVSLSAYRGHPVVLNVWASWCAPCQQEARPLGEAARRWAARGVVFLGVNAQDQDTQALEFVRRNGITYPNGVDRRGTVVRAYGVTGFPETFIIDADGTVLAKAIQAVDAATLDRYLGALALP